MPKPLTELQLKRLIRFRELLLEYEVAPTTLIDYAMAMALDRLFSEYRESTPSRNFEDYGKSVGTITVSIG